MSWTPFSGDPNSQVGEAKSSTIPDDVAQSGTGARMKRRPLLSSRRPGMNSGQRLQTSLAGAVPSAQLTPDQMFFRDSIADGRWGGRLALEPDQIARHNTNMIRRYPDGTCDLVKLEADGKFYLDLGGRGARDTGAGRP